MRFSLSPPHPKATSSAATSPTMQRTTEQKFITGGSSKAGDEDQTETADDAASDYKQWLHAMKLVARLPGGMPPEFRRKLWLSLADKYLKSKNVDWAKEEDKCFCEKWREDDEELGIQIVKDLHRTGSNLCTGPAGSINQAKLKRILLGYARYNPEVGYCQGFNMLGALILQVMDKEESESMKVMIYLVEGVLPPGYFCGSMGGLQADMGVFRELMTSKLPRLAKHLQKLQGPIENAYEPPLTNVFTMQWFLTMFCTCLPMTCVLRVWDLVLIEGSDVLLRTALVLWSLLEERILRSRTADDFYCKMGSFSSELLNGHLIDSNGLIEKVVQLGPIPDIQRLRDKHLYNIAPLRHKQGLQLYFDDEEPESDEESRLAVATVWGIQWGRRGSSGQTATYNKPLPENKDRIALDISLLKKQYDRLRERQKQAHIILTTACSTAARQGTAITTTSNAGNINPTLPVNQFLMGRSAILTNKGRRIGPPPGAIPPARKPSLPAVLQTKPPEKQLRRGETLHWRDTDISKRRRDSLTWKEIKADRVALASRDSSEESQPHKLRTRLGKSDSSSYSDESDDDGDDNDSSTDTSLCDEDDPTSTSDKAHGLSSVENSPKKRTKTSRKQKELSTKLKAAAAESAQLSKVQRRPKSWAPTSDEIPFMLMTSDSPLHSGDEKFIKRNLHDDIMKEEEDSATESDRVAYKFSSDLYWSGTKFSPIAGDLATTTLGPLHIQTDVLELPAITSTSQLSPLPDIARYLNNSAISPLPTPKPLFLDSTNSLGSGDGEGGTKKFDVNDDGVTNEYFERVNSVERPNKLELFYSLSEEDTIRSAYESNQEEITKPIDRFDMDKKEPTADLTERIDRTIIEGCETITVSADFLEDDISDQRHMKLLDAYSEKSSVACIAEAKSEISSCLSKQKENSECAKTLNEVKEEFQSSVPAKSIVSIKDKQKILHRKHSFNESSKKRRDPRRLTITRWSTVEAEVIEYETNLGKSNLKELSSINDFSEAPSVASVIEIPSTADLEERFNRLEKQLSSSNKSSENDKSNIRTDINQCSYKEEINCSDEPMNAVSIPSTENLECRFTALEKQMSSPKASVPKSHIELDINANGTNNSVQNGEERAGNHTPEKTLPTEEITLSQPKEISETNVGCIPSTADLENRFNALERQISASEASAPNNSNKNRRQNSGNSPLELNNVTNQSTVSLESHCTTLEKQNNSSTASIAKNSVALNSTIDDIEISNKNAKQKCEIPTPERNFLEEKNINVDSIPLTTDLESRFTALERQMSSSKTSVPKNSIEPNNKVDETNISEKKQKENAADSQSNNQMKENKAKATTAETEVSETKPEEDSKPRLSKIPSTAELEDRFNALERKISISKSSTTKEKKEPPDPTASRKEMQEQVLPRTNSSDKNKSYDSIDCSKEDNETVSETKKPPSTEELEKRFNNLEKQMSTSQKLQGEKTQPTEQKNIEKDHAEAVSSKSQKSRDTEGETKQLKSMQSFHDKCKSTNERLAEEHTSKVIHSEDQGSIEESTEDAKFLAEAKKIKVMQSFQNQSKTLGVHEQQQEVEGDKKILVIHTTQNNISGKRRASEPPTTEDLESRYEALKRRMSSKTMIDNGKYKKAPLLKSETVEEALERIEKEVLVESEENIEIKDKETENISQPESETHYTENISPESLAVLNKTNIDKRRASEPPTTEELEKRYEKLKRTMSTKAEIVAEAKNELEDKNDFGSEAIEAPIKLEPTDTNIVVNSSSNEKLPHIPSPPPMQSKEPYHDNNLTEVVDKNQRQALVQELQSKMQPNDENLKPSHVNPNQRRIPNQQRPTKVDETSETHATTASKLRLRKKGEPWPIQRSHNMVRRFSDIPSRADLENRVEFLEQQLSLKLIKQRSASDSEVASRTYFVGEGPSTSYRQRNNGDLENRVFALEKQLSENSLKLLEAMRMHNKRDEEENLLPEVINADILDPERTSKELVRYTHYKELEENESIKPINISINIKMHVNKENEKKERETVNLPTTEELEKRLEMLEQQISKSNTSANRQGDAIIKNNKAEESQSETLMDAKPLGEKISSEKTTRDTEKSKATCTAQEEQDIEINDESNKEGKSTGENQITSTSNEKISGEKTSSDTEKSKATFATQEEQDIDKERNSAKENQITSASKETQQLSRTETSVSDKKDQAETVTNTFEKEQSKSVPAAIEAQLVRAESNQSSAKQLKSVDTSSTELDSIKHSKSSSSENKSNTDKTKKEVEEISANQILSKSNEENSEKSIENVVINTSEVGQIDQNRTMVLLLNNEPKAVKVRRLTRANTEELEDLFQALEKQLSERNLIKSEDGKLIRSNTVNQPTETAAESKAISDLTREIQEFTRVDKEKLVQSENYDWGSDPVKHHLKRKTAYLPSTKELEARFRSLERQIKLLEDVENIDVEQRLNEIERKIKLQYSLSHEKDLSKYLELCEGKLPDDEPIATTPLKAKEEHSKSPHTSPGRGKPRSPYTSPSRSRSKEKTPHSSPTRVKERTPYTSPSPPPRTTQRSPYVSPARQRHQDTDSIPCIENLEYRYRVLDLVRSKSKENLSSKSKLKQDLKKQAIHPLEMLLDPSPDESEIPTTGELEHRMRVLDGKSITPSPPRKLPARSPTIDDMRRYKLLEEQRPKTPIHNLETLVVSPTKRDLPTAEELEARMRALEEDQKFDFKMQKNFNEFNQKLKDVVSPSLSFEEFKSAKSREQSPRRSTTPKSAMKDPDGDCRRDDIPFRPTSPKTIRFREDHPRPRSYVEYQRDAEKMVGNADGALKIIEENSKMLHRILKKTIADSSSSVIESKTTSEGLDVFGSRLMRETSPIRRTGTHTGITLRTDDNINDRLNSIKNTIKSIDTLCEEKPYRKEKCQRYIDSLFSDSVYFASPSKKTSLDDLTYKRRYGEYGPSIRVSDHSQRPSDHYLGRSIGSAESLRSTSPLRAASPLHHRSTRDLHRDISPRRRRGDEEREEYESRVRRVNLLPNYLLDDSSEFSRSSLTKFYKVDNELDTYKCDDKARSSSRSASRSPLRSPYGSRETMLPTAHTINNTSPSHNRLDLDRPVSPYRQTSHNLLGGAYDTLKRNNTPVYNPGKLEIRHTTVTSTFYDRFLTEKQIEKSLSRPPSRSPVVSPSVASKSYLDIAMASSLTNSKSNEHTPTTPVMSSSIGITGYGPLGSGNTSSFGYCSSATTTTTTPSTLYTANTTSTGNSSALSNSYHTRLPMVTDNTDSTELRIRSCDNILMQLKSSTATIGAGAGAGAEVGTTEPNTVASTAITNYNQITSTIANTSTTTAAIISNYTNFLNQIQSTGMPLSSMATAKIITTTSDTTNTTFRLTSTGTYNPDLHLSIRPSLQMPEIGIQSSTLLNNNTLSSDFTSLPKS